MVGRVFGGEGGVTVLGRGEGGDVYGERCCGDSRSSVARREGRG